MNANDTATWDSYNAAHNAASQMLRNREIVAYSASYHPRMGRVIQIETEQGWSPDLLFQEFPDD